jgi:hypothetical protein
LKNFYHKGASNQGSEANKDVGSSVFFFLFRLIRLRGGSFLQELYDFEKILAVKKVNADTLVTGRSAHLASSSARGQPVKRSMIRPGRKSAQANTSRR